MFLWVYHRTLYELDFLKTKVGRGFYKFSVAVASTKKDANLIGTSGAEVRHVPCQSAALNEAVVVPSFMHELMYIYACVVPVGAGQGDDLRRCRARRDRCCRQRAVRARQDYTVSDVV